MAIRNIRPLKEHCPSTIDELPFTRSTEDKIQGMRTFKISGDTGLTAPMGGNVTRIYDLPKHDREDVIRRFLEANPRPVEHKPKRNAPAE